MHAKNKEKGVALVLVFMVGVVVTVLAFVFVLRSVSSSRATRYDVNGERAISIADGGVDLAVYSLSTGGSGVMSGQLGGGAYSTQVTPGGGGIYTIVSTATYDGVTRTIECNISITPSALLSPVAAIAVVNDPNTHGFQTTLNGNAFGVVGRDTNVNGSAGTQPALYGIGVWDNQSVTNIVSSLRANGVQNDNITGLGPNPSIGNVSGGSQLSATVITDFATQMRNQADIVTSGGSQNNVTFGTDSSPQITYVTGDIEIKGNSTGSGILVVDGTLNVKGNFTYNGLIVLSGASGGNFELKLSGHLTHHGSIVINNASGHFSNFQYNGNVHTSYSSQGMGYASTAMGGTTPAVVSWRRIQ